MGARNNCILLHDEKSSHMEKMPLIRGNTRENLGDIFQGEGERLLLPPLAAVPIDMLSQETIWH